MNQFWPVVALVAAGCRIIFAIPALADTQRFYIAPDSFEYDQLALNLVQGHGYSQSNFPPYVPDVRRTPMYPLVLAAIYAVAGHEPSAVIATGVVLGVIVCILTLFVGQRLFGTGVGALAGLFVAIDLTSAVYSLTLMSETLFTVLLLLTALACFQTLRLQSRWLVGGAICCGLAILTRPIGIFLPILVAPALMLLHPAPHWRVRVRIGAIFLLLASAFPVGWTARNYLVAGVAQPTSLVAINAYYHRAAITEARRLGVQVEMVRREFAQAGAVGGEQPSELATMQRRALEVVLADPVSYMIVHLRGIARLLGPDRDVMVQLRTGGSHNEGAPRTVTEFVTARGHEHSDTGSAALTVATLQLVALYALAAAGLVSKVRQTALRGPTLFLTIFVLYFVVVSGPEAYARFRVPVMPFVAVLAAVGASAVWKQSHSIVTISTRPRIGEQRIT